MPESQVFERDLPLKTRLDTAIATIKNKGSNAAIKIAGAFGVNFASKAVMNNADFWSSRKAALFGNLGYAIADALPAAAAVWVLVDEGSDLAKGLLNVEDSLLVNDQLAQIDRVSKKTGVAPETAHVLDTFQRYKDEIKSNGKEALTHLLTSFSKGTNVALETTESALKQMGFSGEQVEVLQDQWGNAVEMIGRNGASALAKIVAGVGITRQLAYPIFDTALNWRNLVLGSSNKDIIGSLFIDLREVLGKGWTLPLVCTYLAAKNNMPGFLRGVLNATDVKITRSLGTKIEIASRNTSIKKHDEVNKLSKELTIQAKKSLGKEIQPEMSEAEDNQGSPYERLGFNEAQADFLRARWNSAVDQIAKHGSEAVQNISFFLVLGQVADNIWPISRAFTGYAPELSVLAGLGWVAWRNRDLLTGISVAINVQKEKIQKAGTKEAAAPRERKELTTLLLSIRETTRKGLGDGVDVNSVIREMSGRLLPPPEEK